MTTIEKIRRTVQELDKFELSEQFRESPRSTTSLVNEALLERYTNLRNDYLKSSIENEMAKQVKTFDGENFEMPELPMNAEQVEAQRLESQERLLQTARNAQNNWDQLQADFSRLQERKADLRKMLEEYEKDGDSLDLGTEEDDVVVEEEELEVQQERLLALQQRKKELLSKLHSLQEEHRAVELQSTEAEANISILSYDDEAIVEIEKDNEKLREKIDANKEMAAYFETMRLVTEELSGIRVLAVEDGNGDGVDVVLRLEILYSHQLEISLQADDYKKDCLRVASARLLTPPVITVEVGDDRAKHLELTIPMLDDLVSLAQPQPRSKALAFVIQETACRIEMITKRAEELYRLVDNESYHIEKGEPATNDYGRCDYEVVVTIVGHNVRALVCMTPDCPRVSGSVYLKDISDESNQDILEASKSTLYKRPEDLLEDVKKMLDTRK